MADKSDDDKLRIGNRHLHGLDSVSEQSESSVISKKSPIKISKRVQLRFDGMIVSDESDDDSVYSFPSAHQENIMMKNMVNTYETQHPVESREVTEVKLLSSVKRNTTNILDGVTSPNPDSNVDGLSSFLNISGLSENIPLNVSDIQKYLFQNSGAQDKDQLMATEDFEEEKDFSPSDGSDFDPKEAGFKSDDSEKVSEDEYYDDPMVTELSKQLKRNRKRKCEQFHIDEESDERNVNLQIEEEEEECRPKKMKKSEDTNNKENAEKITGKRTWNRKNACFYCQELVTNFTRHLLRHHSKEIEVIKYQSITDKDPKIRKQKRQAITDKLRNKGNFIHNSKVSFDRDGKSTLLPSKRNNQVTSSPSSYATCKACLGTFKRMTFFRHFKKCGNRINEKNENELPSLKKRVLYNHSITIIPNAANASVELRDNILSHLRSDEISLVVKNDPLIIAYGSRLLKKKKERRSRKAICSKMRDLATLFTLLRKKDTSIETLSDALEPQKYEAFIDAIKTMCGFDEKTGNVNVTSIPARMRPAILGCIDILYTQSIMSTESTAFKEAYKNKLDDFKRLIEINWQWEISSNAEKTRKRINMTKESVIPLDEDISTVTKKIQKLEIKYGAKLRKDRGILNYESLCIVTIAHIIMLDRKRAGDVAEAELTFYINRKNEEVPEKVLETLTSEQKRTIDDLDVFQIPGKRTRAVPILLTKTMRENIDLIVACREDLNIPSSNRYLFARPGTEEPFDGGKCLEKIKKQCNLKRPEMLTSTGMRHHIATMSQIHAKQNDQYTEHLAGFLGHDVAVHAKNYRLPMQVLQKAVVGTQLMEYEKICTQKKQNNIVTKTSHSDENEQPKSLSQNPDGISTASETTSLTSDPNLNPENENEDPGNKNENEKPDKTNENKEPEITLEIEESENINENEQPEFTHKNEDPENINENKRIYDKNKNYFNKGNIESEKHQRTKEEYENTNQITTSKKTTKFVKGNKIETRTSNSSLSNNDENFDQIPITNLDLKNNKKREKSSNKDNYYDDQENLVKRRPTTRQTKVKRSINSTNIKDSSCSSESAKKNKTKMNRNKIQRKKKNNRAPSLSDSSSDEEKPLQKRNKTTHRKWSEEEIKTVKKHFQAYINKKTNPGKSACVEVLKKEPVLRNRTWMQLNTYVNNIYKKK